MTLSRLTSVRIPARIYRRISRIAELQDVSLSTVIVLALTEFGDRFQAGDEIALVRRSGA